MAMTKTEKATMDALKREVSVARALRWTDEVKRDLMPPKQAGEVIQGYEFDDTGFIYHAWSDSTRSGIGIYTEGEGCLISKTPSALYSTEEIALRALRNYLERKCAEALADIDALVEELRQKSNEQ